MGSAMCVPQAVHYRDPRQNKSKRNQGTLQWPRGSREAAQIPPWGKWAAASPAEAPAPAGTCHVSKAASEKAQGRERGHGSLSAASAPAADPAPSPQGEGELWEAVRLPPHHSARLDQEGEAAAEGASSKSWAAKDTGAHGAGDRHCFLH